MLIDKKFELIFESYFRKVSAKIDYVPETLNKKLFANQYGMYDQHFVYKSYLAYQWLYNTYFDRKDILHGDISFYRDDLKMVHNNVSNKFIKEFICDVFNEKSYVPEKHIYTTKDICESHFMFKSNENYNQPEVEKFYFNDNTKTFVLLFVLYLIDCEDVNSSIKYTNDILSEVSFEQGVNKTVIVKIKGDIKKQVIESLVDLSKKCPNFNKDIHQIFYIFTDYVDIIETDKEIKLNVIKKD